MVSWLRLADGRCLRPVEPLLKQHFNFAGKGVVYVRVHSSGMSMKGSGAYIKWDESLDR